MRFIFYSQSKFHGHYFKSVSWIIKDLVDSASLLRNAQVGTKKPNISNVICKRKQMKRSVRCVVAESGIGIFCFLSQFVNSALSGPFRSACSETTFISNSLPKTNSRRLALMEFSFLTSVNNGDSSKLTFRPNLTSLPRAFVHELCKSTLYQAAAV